MKKQLVLLTNNYPSHDNIYANGFIHSRVKFYLEEFDVTVIIWSPRGGDSEYEFENVKVIKRSRQDNICDLIKKIKPSSIAIHFVEGWMLDKIIKPFKGPVNIWVHGVEALGWYRRLFNKYTIRELAGYIYRNTIQLFKLRKIILFSNSNPRVRFIFVSEWMKRITEADTFSKIKYFDIIANPIDTEQFFKKGPKAGLRTKILLIRPFATKKYANDIAVRAIQKLAESSVFDMFDIFIYGDGVLFDKETKAIKEYRNVHLNKKFVPHNEINDLHDQCGIFLSPTRQDAQGVSMCEAMASGLVVITSNNTAIPEFVKNNETGILTNSPEEIADAILKLYDDPGLFESISYNGEKSINSIAGRKSVIERELKLLNR